MHFNFPRLYRRSRAADQAALVQFGLMVLQATSARLDRTVVESFDSTDDAVIFFRQLYLTATVLPGIKPVLMPDHKTVKITDELGCPIDTPPQKRRELWRAKHAAPKLIAKPAYQTGFQEARKQEANSLSLALPPRRGH